MYCPNCGTELDDQANFCGECGTDVTAAGSTEATRSTASSPTTGSSNQASTTAGASTQTTTTGGATAATTSSSGGVPSNAAAIDITCQHCGERPIQEIAKGHRVTGLVLFYRRKTYELIGCHQCIRRKLWGMSAKNLVLGWWGIRAAVMNVILTIKNIVRGAINRGPNANLVESLEDIGVTYDYLDDPDAFDAARHSAAELYVRSFVRLGTAIMLADGEAHEEERQAIHDTITSMFPDVDPGRLDDLIDRASQSPADIERVAEGLSEVLAPEGQQMAIGFAAEVAEAGVTGQEDIELASSIARGMGLDENDVEEALASPPTATA